MACHAAGAARPAGEPLAGAWPRCGQRNGGGDGPQPARTACDGRPPRPSCDGDAARRSGTEACCRPPCRS
ncbi:hypothetical protein G6F21_014732 [Rhizopus arrhizus]|uniref:Uncharacterized protein n=1 Tax=Rhizopus oryzae TaxID=64495 RepID=A0A9P6WSX4_RHIOR|nr:hypothetical protein G6F21_014732 [Rhizopus arrhizus]KAG1277190.1 hypothetical protein G6F64_014740 [Rhizopus arrhizus]